MDKPGFTHIDGRLTPHAGSQTLAADTNAELPDARCRFVQLHNWTANAGTVSATGEVVTPGGGIAAANPYTPTTGAGTTIPADAVDGSEIYYGFEKQLVAQIFPGTSTEILPCTNLREITVRPGPQGAREVFYTYWT